MARPKKVDLVAQALEIAYQAGVKWREEFGEEASKEKVKLLEKRIPRNTERRISTRRTREIIRGLSGK